MPGGQPRKPGVIFRASKRNKRIRVRMGEPLRIKARVRSKDDTVLFVVIPKRIWKLWRMERGDILEFVILSYEKGVEMRDQKNAIIEQITSEELLPLYELKSIKGYRKPTKK
ncbi:MAG TPA: hypothetical protein ENI13_01310 [candidate division CPR3 bacterium]|uniref:Uncharacterized protein n=1 Tax=candidate division CPR3 bacterium TaxID=2268181 RepID=A0A7C1SR62_UNCC3|nr:hypothetical protein [candidate division CPR3 bacterium]